MKYLVFILLIVSISSIYSQQTIGSWELENGQLSFVKRYDFQNPDAELIRFFESKKEVSNLIEKDSRITFDIVDYMVNIHKQGYEWDNVPDMMRHHLTGKVEVLILDDKYKVKFYNIVSHTKNPHETIFDESFTKKKGTELKVNDR